MMVKQIFLEKFNDLSQLSFWQRGLVFVLLYLMTGWILINEIVTPRITKMQNITAEAVLHQNQIYLWKGKILELKSFQWQYQLLMLNQFFENNCQQIFDKNILFSELNRIAQLQKIGIEQADPLPLNQYHWSFRGNYQQFYAWLKAIDNLPQMILLKSCHMIEANEESGTDELIIDVTMEVLPWSSQSCRYF